MILWPFEQRSQALGEVKARMIHNIVNIVFSLDYILGWGGVQGQVEGSG